MTELTKKITVENQHAVTIDITKTKVELPDGDNRTVKVWFRRIEDGGLTLSIDVENRPGLLDGCPNFEDSNYEPILAWAANVFDAKVRWSDAAYSAKDLKAGKKIPHHSPDYAMWSLRWRHGSIGMDHLPGQDKETENKARKTAALFIYLYSHGVSAMVAHRCADEYVKGLEIETL